MKAKKKKLGVVALKHKIVLDNLTKKIGKGRKMSLTKAVVEAGYSESYARSGNIKKKKSWNQLMEEYLPDDFLAETHQKLLKAKQIRQLTFNYKLKDAEIEQIIADEGYTFIGTKRFMTNAVVFFSAPDGLVIKGALDLAHKIKGKNAPEKFQIEESGIRAMSDSDLMALINKQKARFNKTD